MSDPRGEYFEALAGQLAAINLRDVAGLAGDRRMADISLDRQAVLPRLRLAGATVETTIAAVLAEHRCVVLEGEPGGGKTTALRLLCLAYARATDDLRTRMASDKATLPPGLVPIFVRLGSFAPASDRASELHGYLERELAADGFSAPQIAMVMAALADGSALLCLDGLDEILRDPHRRFAVQVIERWVSRGGRCWVSVRGSTEHGLAGPFVRCELLGFSARNIEEFVVRRALLFGLSPDEGRRYAASTLAALREDPGVARTACVPLLLAIALSLGDAPAALPGERVRLYARVIDTLVRTWNEARLKDAALCGPGGVVFAAPALIRVWAEVALELHEEAMLADRVHRHELVRRLTRRLGDETRAEAALAVFSAQAGLLVPDGPTHLRFWHATFGEYLAAIGLARRARRAGGPLPLARRSREVACMALAWARCVDDDGRLAGDMFSMLLDPVVQRPWARVFAAAPRLAVQCLSDGPRGDDPLFGRVLSRVLDGLALAPTHANSEALVRLATQRPEYAPESTSLRRIAALVDPRARDLEPGFIEPLVLWLSRATRAEPAASECCEALMRNKEGWRRPRWAAVGLLRVGVVTTEVCEAIARSVDVSLVNREPDACFEAWRQLSRELAALEPDSLGALRERLAGAEPGLREAAGCVLAMVGEHTPTNLAVLWDGATSGRLREACTGALAWLAVARGGPALDRLCAGLVAGHMLPGRVLCQIVQARDGQPRRVAARTIAALVQASAALPEPRVMLGGDAPQFIRELQELADAHEDVTAELLTAMSASERAGWWIAATLWRTGHWRNLEHSEAAARVLIRALLEPDLELAVASANLLAQGWDWLSAAGHERVIAAWIRGLAAVDDDVSGYASAQLRKRVGDSDGAVARALAEIDVDEPRIAVAVASLLHALPERAENCRETLVAALAAEDLALVQGAYWMFRAGEVAIPEGDGFDCASLRLWFAGRLSAGLIPSGRPPSRRAVELYLDLPRLADEAVDPLWSFDGIATWLAECPDARSMVMARLGDPRCERLRVELLLAKCHSTPGAIEALTREVLGMDQARVDVVDRALCRCGRAKDPAIVEAARRGRLVLLRPRLAASDLAAVHEATGEALHLGEDRGLVASARARVLAGGSPALRLALLEQFVSWHREPLTDETIQGWFACETVVIVAALRELLSERDDSTRISAAAMLWRLTGATDELLNVCWQVLEEPALVCEDGEDVVEDDDGEHWPIDHWTRKTLSGWLAASEPSRTRRRALACLLQIGDALAVERIVAASVQQLAGELGVWRGRGVVDWVVERWPERVGCFVPWFAASLRGCELREVREHLRWICEHAEIRGDLALAVAERWCEWSYYPFRDADETFVEIDEVATGEVHAAWRGLLGHPIRETRGGAALALAGLGQVDALLVDALIDVFQSWVPPAAGRAWDLLRSPQCAELFVARRRARALEVTTADEAAALLGLWVDLSEPEVLLPLLRQAVQAGDEHVAHLAAFDLDALDPGAARAALARLMDSSDETVAVQSAAWLFVHDHELPRARERLWSALAGRGSVWNCAAAVLAAKLPDSAQLHAALAVQAGTGEDVALWLLARLAGPERAFHAVMEALAGGGEQRWRCFDHLEALCHGRMPGSAPYTSLVGLLGNGVGPWFDDAPRELRSEPSMAEPLRRAIERVEHGPTLEDTARGLVELPWAGTPLARWIAGLVAGPEGVALWERGDLGAGDRTRLATIVHARPGDSPGLRLARLWWLIQLDEGALLEHEDRLAGLPADGIALLAELLRRGFSDEDALRRMFTTLEDHVVDKLPGRTSSFHDLILGAADVLQRHGLEDAALARAPGSLAAELRALWAERCA